MSWHCLFCGGPDQWVRGKERPLEKDFVELAYYDPFGKKGKRKRLNSWCAHASCLRLVLKAGQNRYLEDGELYDFEELTNFINEQNGENAKRKNKEEEQEYKEMENFSKIASEVFGDEQ